MIPKKIVAIGASSCEGKVDFEGNGFVGRLKTWHEGFDVHNHQVYNLGIPGDSTTGILKRIISEVSVRKPGLILIQLGINDTRREGSASAPCETSLTKFRANLTELIKKAKSLAEVIFVSVYPIDDSKTTPASWRPIYYFSRDAEKYAQAMKDVCRELKVPYIDIFNQWLKTNYKEKYLYKDGLHANSNGHKYIFEQVKSFLENRYKE